MLGGQAYSEEALRRAESSIPEGAVLTHVYAFPRPRSAGEGWDTPVAVPREQADRIFRWLELEAAQLPLGADYAPELDDLLKSASDSDSEGAGGLEGGQPEHNGRFSRRTRRSDPTEAPDAAGVSSPPPYVPSFMQEHATRSTSQDTEGRAKTGRRRMFHAP